MPEYSIPCPDGTDRKCWGEVTVEIDEVLHPSEVEQYIEDHQIPVDVCGACGSDSDHGDEDDED